MATIIYPNTFVANTPARASEVNANFTAITAQVNGNLEAANLANNAVTTVKIADANVTDAKISAVAASKLTGTVSNAQLASGIDAAKLTTGTLPIARIADGAVTAGKVDFINPLSATGNIYFGRVASDATISIGPSGWTCTSSSTGNYILTHNLGDSEYVILVTPNGTPSWSPLPLQAVAGRFANYAEIQVYSDASVVNYGFSFILIVP